MPDSLLVSHMSAERLVLTHHGNLFGDGVKQLPISTAVRLLRLLLAKEHQTLETAAGSDQWHDEHNTVTNQSLNIGLGVQFLFFEGKGLDLGSSFQLSHERRIAALIEKAVAGC
jgi:hypothetical protein